MKVPTIKLKLNRPLALGISVLMTLLIAGCGESPSDAANDNAIFNSSLIVTPSQVDLTTGRVDPEEEDPMGEDMMGNCFAVDSGYNVDQLFQVNLRGNDNAPIKGEKIYAIIDFGENNSDFEVLTQLWKDVDNNGVIDETVDELSNDAGDGALVLKTNSNGVVRFIVRYTSGCAFRANLLVLTDGGAEASVSISVTAQS